MKWNEYFMSIALISSKRSKDPNTKVGTCIVNPKKRIVGVGYNGMPKGLDESFSWEREGDDTKYKYVVHAELNAILNSIKDLDECTLYTTLFPCPECAKAIVQSGIKKVFYMSDKYDGTEDNKAAKKIFNECNIDFVELPCEIKIMF